MNHPYLPLTATDRQEMLDRIGVKDFEQLLGAIPAALRYRQPLALGPGRSEPELTAELESYLRRNSPAALSFLGGGAYQHFIPVLVDQLAGRAEFYTAYTPYQPELSQGMLQAIFEYQTMLAELFGLPVVNASLYDGPTALAEAVLLAVRQTKTARVLVPANLLPQLRQVLQTYSRHLPLELVSIATPQGRLEPELLAAALQSPAAALVAQQPNGWGIIEDLAPLFELTKSNGAVPIAYVQPLTLGQLAAPGALGAEIVVGEGQPLGLPLAYGGPYLGLMAVAERFIRAIPGRLVGQTVDAEGRRAFVLTLQTREQHIRREKATSNICSNQALCALRAAIYLATIGPQGLAAIAQRCWDNAHYLQAELAGLGLELCFKQPFFMEFAVRTPQPAAVYLEKLAARGIQAGLDLEPNHPELGHALLICATEVFSRAELDRLVTEMGAIL